MLPLLVLGLLGVGVHGAAPIVGLDNANAGSNSYIVVLKKTIADTSFNSHLQWADKLLKTNSVNTASTAFDIDGFRGYGILATKVEVEALAESVEIDYIEADLTFTIDKPARSTHRSVTRNVQPDSPWGLARISHRQKGSTEYVFSPTTGTYIYILDTGVRVTHQKFQGRASYGFNAVGGSNDDLNGHGTHVAGIASSQTYGVGRFSNIISVKVLGDSGTSTTATLISGINWATQDMQNKGRVGKATALLAVGGAYSAALNNAVAAASNSGLFFAAVAGNDNTNAGNFSPGSEPTACTVGGTTIDDAKMPSSNYGPVVDIYAPGAQIPSLWITSDTAITTLSGTSMAAAHVAGLAAYFLAIEGARGAVALCERLREVATKNALSGIPPGTSNLLAYNNSGL